MSDFSPFALSMECITNNVQAAKIRSVFFLAKKTTSQHFRITVIFGVVMAI